MIWLFGRSGAPDISFSAVGIGSFGEQLTAGEGEYAAGIAVDAAGEIVIAGSAPAVFGSDVPRATMVWRLDDTGTAEAGFTSSAWAQYRSVLSLADAYDNVAGAMVYCPPAQRSAPDALASPSVSPGSRHLRRLSTIFSFPQGELPLTLSF